MKKTHLIIACFMSWLLATSLMAQTTINKAEYYFDTDPGIGNATDLPLSSVGDSAWVNGTIPANLPIGWHLLYVRARDASGNWSTATVHVVLVESATNGATISKIIDKAEYYFDTDPGIGNATDLPLSMVGDSAWVSNASLPQTLTAGWHQAHFRVRDASDNWSMVESFPIWVQTPEGSPVATTINKAEYFFNTDPGIGNGIDIPLSNVGDSAWVSNTSVAHNLPIGWHQAYIRVRDVTGKWSTIESHPFLVQKPSDDVSTPVATTIDKAEYFFNTDPGVGNGFDIPLSNVGDSAWVNRTPVAHNLPVGWHQAYIRVRDVTGKWSTVESHPFLVQIPSESSTPVATTIDKAEYFFDTDPGVGNGKNLPLSMVGDSIAVRDLGVSVGSLTTGLHQMYTRVRDVTGKWSTLEPQPIRIIETVGETAAALHFDGGNDYITLPSALSTAATSGDAITIEYWFKGTNMESAVRLDGSGSIVCGNNNTHYISADGQLPIGSTALDGNWHHIAMTWQRNTPNGYKSYVDGILVAQKDASNTPLPTATSGVRLGSITGSMDELRIWNRAVAQCEIQNNMSCELPTGNARNGLLGYYQFNQGVAFGENDIVTTLLDESSYANHGTLYNFALTGITSNWTDNGGVTKGVSCPANYPSVSIAITTGAQTISYGTSVTFAATPTNIGGSPIYQWKKNNVDVGTNSPNYTDALLFDGDIVSCVVSTTNCSAISNPVKMIVTNSPAASSLHFDGTNDYISNNAIFTTAPTDFTVEFWLNPTSRTDYNQQLGGVTGWGGFYFHTTSDGSIYVGTDVGTRITPSEAGANTLTLNTWQHFAFTYSGGTGTLYKNGALIATKNNMLAPRAWNGFQTLSGSGVNGSLDEVRIWNRALPQSEIQGAMNCELGCARNGLLAYYRFNQGIAYGNNAGISTLTDDSGNGYNGTLTNFALTGRTSNWAYLGGVTTGANCSSAATPSVSITASPNTTICAGTSVTFTANASNVGDGTVTYNFKIGSTSVQNSTSNTYSNTTLANGNTVTCTITISGGTACLAATTATSNAANMTVNPSGATPSVNLAASPSGTICKGASVTFTANAANTGGGTVTYDFKVRGSSMQNSAANTFTSTTLTQGDSVKCEITITGSACLASTTATSNVIVMAVNAFPATPFISLTASPSATICTGTPVIFTANASRTGGGIVSYNFKIGGVSVQNGTSNTFTSATLANENQVNCVITITDGSCLAATTATSSPIFMSVNAPVIPSVKLVASTSSTICEGTSVTFTTTSSYTGRDSVFYIFKINGTTVRRSLSNTLTATTFANNDVVTCEIDIRNPSCPITAASNGLRMSVSSGGLPLTITAQPQAQTICSGSNAALSVTATGTNLTYQWLKNGENISGANSATYTITGANTLNSGNYSVIVSGDCSRPVTSDAVALTINPLTAIATQPTAQTACLDGNVTFKVVATGVDLRYQWQKNGEDISGANSASFTITGTTLADVANYRVIVSGTCSPSVMSNAVSLSFSNPIVVTVNRGTATICENATRNITATTTGGVAPYSYAWEADAGVLSSSTGNPVTYSPPDFASITTFTVTVTDNAGCQAIGDASLFNLPIPTVVITPVTQTLCSGDNLTTIVATNTKSGISANTLTWTSSRTNTATVVGIGNLAAPTSRVGSVTIPASVLTNTQSSTQTSVITIRATTSAAAGGCVNEATATVNVNVGAILTQQPTAQINCENSSVTFTANAIATGTLTYEWYKSGNTTPLQTTSSVASGTANAFTLSNLALTDAGDYYAVVKGSACPTGVKTNTVALTVKPNPTISSVTPSSTAVCDGTAVAFSANGLLDGSTTFNLTIDGVPSSQTVTVSGGRFAFASALYSVGDHTIVINSATINGCTTTFTANNSTTFTVRPTPKLSSTLTPSAICNGATFSYSPTSATTGATFAWKRAEIAGITEGGTSGTGNVNETLTNTTTDPIVVTYTFVTTANECKNAPQSVTITVNPTPKLSSTLTPSAICSGTTFSYTPTSVTTGAIFAWKRAEIAGITEGGSSGTGNVSEILTNTTAEPIVVTYTIITTINGCSSTPQSVTVTVNPMPLLKGGLANAPICSGTTFNFIATSATGGATFTWKRTTIAGISEAGTSGTGDISEMLTNTTTAPIIVSYAYTLSANSCNNEPQNITVTVNPTPRVTVTSANPILVCPDAGAFPLSFTTTAIAPYTYTLRAGSSNAMTGYETASVPNNTSSRALVNIGTPSLLMPTNGSPYEFRLFIADANGCVSANSVNADNGVLARVRVMAFPYAAFAPTAPISLCAATSTNTLTVNLDGTDGTDLGFDAGNPKTLVYSINGVNQPPITNINTNSVTIPVLQGGMYALVSVNAFCQGFINPTTVTVYDGRTSIATHPSNQSICLGSSVTLSGAATPSVNPPVGRVLTYNWQVNNGSGFVSIGVSTPTYTFTPTIADNGKQYRLQAYYANSLGFPACGVPSIANSNVAMLTVSEALTGVIAGADQNISTSTTALAGGLGTGTTGAWSVVPANTNIIFTPNVNTVTATVSGLPVGMTTFRWTVSNGGCRVSDDVVITREGISLTAVVLLHGNLDTSGSLPIMRDDLRRKGFLPLTSPYSVAPWNAPAATIDPSVLANQADPEDNIVDWILVELRDARNPTTVIEKKPALVKRNGFIVEVDGQSPVHFTAAEGNYYIAIRHRSHLGIMSAIAVDFATNTTTLYDFTDGFTNLYPTYTLTNTSRSQDGQRSNIKGAFRAMWSGNTNPAANPAGKYVNGIGSGNDYAPILLRLGTASFKDGYFIEDTNLNGRVQYIGTGNDKVPVFTTALTGVVWEQLPENN